MFLKGVHVPVLRKEFENKEILKVLRKEGKFGGTLP